MPGLTLEELTDRVMSTVHGEEAEPHVFAALHMLSGCGSSQAYLLFFCASAKVELRKMHNHKHAEIEKVCFGNNFINIARPHFHSWIFTELPEIFPELELQISVLLAHPRGPFPTVPLQVPPTARGFTVEQCCGYSWMATAPVVRDEASAIRYCSGFADAVVAFSTELLISLTSARRFLERPALVLLEPTGAFSPSPIT